MKEILSYLLDYKTLTKAEAKTVLKNIAHGHYAPAQVAAFMTIYMMRSITVEELEGFRDAMLELCVPVDLSAYEVIDLCGTGGDGKNTFNISTLASLVVAAAGQPVAKHGNYGVSSVCGSSNVLEALGVQFTNDEQQLRRQIEEAGICFLHAPLFHPAMKNVAPVRRELGVKTFFNMLGPMVNPAFPSKQMVGVFNMELLRLYAYLYQRSGKQFAIVHSLAGYDEVSLTSAFKMMTHETEVIMEPEMLGFPRLQAEELHGGATVEEAAALFLHILKGEGTPAQEAAVVANAAVALHVAGLYASLDDCRAAAFEALKSGEALRRLKKIQSLNQNNTKTVQL
ncbi:anthranilate phosphoribosyltransferase [Thermonema lapsum]|uniref:Anthranilate phosphoribosyltransferase n=1 Tax=Thermonema lapsum TaxID=28195 RepID=A0A846MMX7_9BACT|nr:anthranilate phosphoribosyltransferase [Thermonema lapsum]NIK72819.1 anthranilate phosphoribosyltransferase [Thermonema lapsum]